MQALCRTGLCLQAPAPAHWAQPEVFRHACYSSYTDHDLWGIFLKDSGLSQMPPPAPPPKSEMRTGMSGSGEEGKPIWGITEQVTPVDNWGSILLGPGRSCVECTQNQSPTGDHYPLVLITWGRKQAQSWAARPGAISMHLHRGSCLARAGIQR